MCCLSVCLFVGLYRLFLESIADAKTRLATEHHQLEGTRLTLHDARITSRAQTNHDAFSDSGTEAHTRHAARLRHTVRGSLAAPIAA